MIIPVILSGGAGTRLWPVSREGHPKPFMALADGQSLLEKTYRRAAAVIEARDQLIGVRSITVTNERYVFLCRDEADRAGVNTHFILEPMGRNTAPAIALAAHEALAQHGSDAQLLVLAADHLITNQAAFLQSVHKAEALANQGYLATFGIVPTSPETGFGYIQCADSLTLAGEILGYRVARFVEKPDRINAQSYLDAGGYLWNSGMFCFRADMFLAELARCTPDMALAVEECRAAMVSNVDLEAKTVSADLFGLVPDLSVDYAVMEKSDRVAVVPATFDWSDIGSWNAVSNLSLPDAAENRIDGEAMLIDCKASYFKSSHRLIAGIGLNNLLVVDTPDALLIADKDRAQEVKQVAEKLRLQKHQAADQHRTVGRPWGTYTILEESPGFKIKRIVVNPGASLSLQMHHHRSEHWVVVSGIARVTNGEQIRDLVHNESTYIKAGEKHRLENPGDEPCVMIEVQCGAYLGEDDIVRFEDTYGRS